MDGLIKYRERNRQVIDFQNLQWGDKVHPTDIDGCIEYHDKAVIFFEMKYGDAVMPKGQALAFTRICDDLRKVGKTAVLIEAEHYIADCEESVDAGGCRVRKCYVDGKWYEPTYPLTVKEVCTTILNNVDGVNTYG